MLKRIKYTKKDAECESACDYWGMLERVQDASDIQRIVVDGVLKEKKDEKIIWIRDFLKL